MRLLFLGTPEFAVPSLRALAAGPHPVVGVISQPDRPRGRGRRLEPTPVRAAAEALGLDLIQPEKVGEPGAREWMAAREPELGCVVAFGQFVPRSVRELPPHGMINAHASLLPRHRGAAPIQHAILAGDAMTGVSVMRLVREMDAGDYCLVRETPIGPDETAGELSERLAALAAEALVEAVAEIAAGRAVFRPQDPAGVTLAPKLDRAFARVDWSEPAARVYRRIRAASPWPGVDVGLRQSGARFRILQAGLESVPTRGVRAGEVRVDPERRTLRIACADGWIAVRRLRVPGRRAVDSEAFLRGARIPDDEAVELQARSEAPEGGAREGSEPDPR